MRRSLTAALVAFAVLALASAIAFGVRGESRQDVGYPSTGMMHGPGAGSDWNRGRVDGMHGVVPASEFDFLARMVAHHREAVSAAKELGRSDRPEMRAFGASVVATQTAQIEQMRDWLARWHPDRSVNVEYRPMMRDLSGLAGRRLDRAFLTDMVPHHMVAVMMSQRLLMWGVADHPQVNVLARSIRNEQHDEILRMQRWLASGLG